MTASIYLAPAASGKTAYALRLAREASRGLRATPRVVVPTHLQARACRRRLAELGGAMGVHVLTFDRLTDECLAAAGETYVELSDPVQFRLVRSLLDELPLTHYAPLRDRPGFVQVLQGLIGELKAAQVWPEALAAAVAELGGEPRLDELALIYAAYQAQLHARGWADRAGLGWLAVEALAERAPDVARDWSLLVVDGFDSFTPVQLALLATLGARAEHMVVTLTGALDARERALVHRRFTRTRRDLEERLGVRAVPLPELDGRHAAPLAHLESGMFCGEGTQVDADGAVELVAAPDRAAEARAALRWLKARLVQDGLRPGEVALLARDVGPYRPFILQTAAEFGLPVRVTGGVPLRTNPAVAALLDLLRLVLPSPVPNAAARETEPALPWRLVLEAWRSPYFDWSEMLVDGRNKTTDAGGIRTTEAGPVQPARAGGIRPLDAGALDAAVRWGRVVGGLAQWEEILGDLAARGEPDAVSGVDEERGVPPDVPVGEAARVLGDQFDRFVRRITPPQGRRSYREFVVWLEDIIGADPALRTEWEPEEEPAASPRLVACVRQADPETAGRDVAALRALKDVLRGLVWAEEALTPPPVDFERFFDELSGAVEAASYHLPVEPGREEVIVADVIQARGVPFRAVAVVGLAEGEFPAAISEDPFLRDADRVRLREGFGLQLERSTESSEAEFFYETLARARERLLLTRPRLADNGASWQASPFWEEVLRCVSAQPETLTSESIPPPAQAASWPELMESLATYPDDGDARDWVRQAGGARLAALDMAARVLDLRRRGNGAMHDGDLEPVAERFARRYGPAHTWSASRLEAYRTCPFMFFINSVLGLEPREEPTVGLDVRQRGTIYHVILERLYAAVDDPTSLVELLAALPGVAGPILEEAPRREGFRATAWWRQTCDEILAVLRQTLEALAELQEEFVPFAFEARFGIAGLPPLVVDAGGDSFRVRGVIDRVDSAPGHRVRIIDYKTGGPSPYSKRALEEGKKLQAPLYALAARDALELGDPVDGFYWHVRHARRSGLTLRGFEGGPEAAMDLAVEYTWEAIRGIRAGRFVPRPPADGCPAWCAAAAFCWHHRPGFGG